MRERILKKKSQDVFSNSRAAVEEMSIEYLTTCSGVEGWWRVAAVEGVKLEYLGVRFRGWMERFGGDARHSSQNAVRSKSNQKDRLCFGEIYVIDEIWQRKNGVQLKRLKRAGKYSFGAAVMI